MRRLKVRVRFVLRKGAWLQRSFYALRVLLFRKFSDAFTEGNEAKEELVGSDTDPPSSGFRGTSIFAEGPT